MRVVPMPIYHGHGHVSPEAMVGLLIACNLFILAVFLIFVSRWLYLRYVKNDEYLDGFFNYTIWDDFDSVGACINTMCFIIINGIALLFVVANFFTKLL